MPCLALVVMGYTLGGGFEIRNEKFLAKRGKLDKQVNAIMIKNMKTKIQGCRLVWKRNHFETQDGQKKKV